MVVVLGIIAILTSIGAGALLSARTNAQVDAVTEDLVSAIREAQNNSISIKRGVDHNNDDCEMLEGTGSTTKVWGITINKTAGNTYGYFKNFYCSVPDTTVGLTEASLNNSIDSPYPNIIITDSEPAGSPTQSIYFSAPFGKGFVAISPTDGGLGYVTPSAWYQASGINKEYRPPNTQITNTDTTLYVRKTNGGYTREVVIKPNGDVYAR